MTSVRESLASSVRSLLQKYFSEQLASLTDDFLAEHICTLGTEENTSPDTGSPSSEDDTETPPSSNTICSPELLSCSASKVFSSSSLARCRLPSSHPLDTAVPMDKDSEDVRMQEEGKDRTKDVVGSFMSKDPVCLNKDMTLLEAVKLLLRHNISGAPVVEPYPDDASGSGRLVGVLSEEDLLWKEVEATDKGISEQFREPYLWSLMASDNIMMEAVENQALKVLSNTVGLSMSEMSISVSPETPMSEAASIMLDAKVKRLPVVATREGGKPGMTVVGIITRKDMLGHVMGLLEKEDGANRMEADQSSGVAA